MRLDIGDIGRLDTIGAWLLSNFQRGLAGGGAQLVGGSDQHRRLLERIGQSDLSESPRRPRGNILLVPFEQLGRIIIGSGQDAFAANAVQGRLLAALGRTASLQAPLRFASFINQFEQIVLRAIPIVALISVVVGAIITQQTILQLRAFGAVIFVVDLAAILMFREIGVLLAAIMVAGRSGSAITAEVGAMRIREEFDALRVMGVDPYQALLLPRVVALVVGLPLLAFVGSMAGLLGAALVARYYGDVPFNIFIDRLRDVMTPTSLLVGMIKAPFMAFLIGLIASIEGMKVEGSSEALGRRTTSSVVKSIFVVIVADGLFAVFFAAIGF
ncbi:MlaE family ABC transporter permease [uncultured Devosia sp.]|uniref:MlaE family ABC transporter permease n=1 Tax=uncultured Devosia sp. TaxID=211434 RepID=UPI0035C96E74